MMNRPLGCFTGGGLLAAGLTLALVLVIFVFTGGAMFSPGPLSAHAGDEQLGEVRSHAETAGNCAACHAAPWSGVTLADRCLSCHSAVADELTVGQGLHAQMKGQAPSLGCRGCHTEHRGATAALTEIQPDDFPHSAMGYELAGHQSMVDGRAFACGDCHTESVAKFAVGTCTDCHRDIDATYMNAHLADFGQTCLGCHDGVDRYSRARFDHNAFSFPLEGRHAEIACSQCHAGATTVSELQSAKAACVDCHQDDDTHKGEFGSDCGACHNATSWPDAQFNHSKTSFPLTGKHAGVKCEDCHKGGVFRGTQADCVACHADPPYHQGEFGTRCADCHDAAGWEPALLNLPHAFPIDHGEGGPSSCRTCHSDSVRAYTCYGCHEHTPAETIAEHEGEVSGDISDCARCHPRGEKEEGEEREGEGH